MQDLLCDVLIVIDMQNDFITGSLGTKEAQEIVPNVVEKCKHYSENNKPIYFTQDTHYRNYLTTLEGKYLPIIHCKTNSFGWEIHEDLKAYIEPYCKYKKETFGYIEKYAFERDEIDGYLFESNRYAPNSIEICGLCTDICVISNALILRAKFPNTKIYCDHTCCAGTTPFKHEAALNVMKSCQIEII